MKCSGTFDSGSFYCFGKTELFPVSAGCNADILFELLDEGNVISVTAFLRYFRNAVVGGGQKQLSVFDAAVDLIGDDSHIGNLFVQMLKMRFTEIQLHLIQIEPEEVVNVLREMERICREKRGRFAVTK